MPTIRNALTQARADGIYRKIIGSVLIVDLNGEGDYSTIQAAIDDASSGDYILVYPGTYTENLVITNKSLKIVGFGSGVTAINGSPAITLTKSNNDSTYTAQFFDFDINSTGSNPVCYINNNVGGSRQARLNLTDCTVYSSSSASAISLDGTYITRLSATNTLFTGESADIAHIESTANVNSYILLYNCDHDGCTYRLSMGRLIMYNSKYINSVVIEAGNTNSQSWIWEKSIINGPVSIAATGMTIEMQSCIMNSSTNCISLTAANNNIKARYTSFSSSGSLAEITSTTTITADIFGCAFSNGMQGNIQIAKPIIGVGAGTDSYYTIQDALDSVNVNDKKIILYDNQTITSALTPPSYSIMIDGNHQFNITRSAGNPLMTLSAGDNVKFVNIDLVGSIDVTGDATKLLLADHTYLIGMVDIQSGNSNSEIKLDQCKIIGDTSDNYCIRIADADPIITIKRSYLKANGANPAIYWDTITNDNLKIAWAAIVHGSAGANNPFGRSGAQTPDYCSHHAAYTHDPETGGTWTNLIGTHYDIIDTNGDY